MFIKEKNTVLKDLFQRLFCGYSDELSTSKCILSTEITYLIGTLEPLNINVCLLISEHLLNFTFFHVHLQCSKF